MFRCDICGSATLTGEKMRKRTLATRKVAHPKRYKLNAWGERMRDAEGRPIVLDNGGCGEQIVREASVGPCCAIDTDR